jgi:hypothetical protein
VPLPMRVMNGLVALFRRGRAEKELDAELRAFLEMDIEQKMRAGLNGTEAARAARLELGSMEAVKDHVRDVGWEFAIESVWQDMRYAVRGLRKSPGFTTVAVLTLAVGSGATTAMFNLLDAVILEYLPVRNPEQLVLVKGDRQYPVFQGFRRHTDIFVDLFATSGVTPLDVEIGSDVRERTGVSLVSGSYFSTLGVQAAIGRIFTVDDDRAPGEHPVAVASHGYWQRSFGRDAAILNRVVRIGGTPITIIGVAPPGFFGEQVGVAPDLWVPLTMWGIPFRNRQPCSRNHERHLIGAMVLLVIALRTGPNLRDRESRAGCDARVQPLDGELRQRIGHRRIRSELAVDREHRDAVHRGPDEASQYLCIVGPYQAVSLQCDQRTDEHLKGC